MTAEIHPTAVVAQGAALADSVTVGPYCVIGPEVRIGAGCRLHSHVVVDGPVTLGPECEVFPFACLGKRTQDLKYRGGTTPVYIGARTTIREYGTVHQATATGGETRVGEDCTILAYAHVAHDCVVGDRVIMSNGFSLGGHVVIEDMAVCGGLGGVHQFARIGRLAMVAALSKAVQDVMPFCIAEGNPAHLVGVNRVGMQRNGRTPEDIQLVTQVYRLFFRSGLPLEVAIERAAQLGGEHPDVRAMVEFAHTSNRGLVRTKKRT